MALAAAQATGGSPLSPPLAPVAPATVEEFLVQADALVAVGGEAAVNSPQADVIREAMMQAAMAYRASLAQAAQRGERPSSCPPPPGQAQLSLGDMMGFFRAFPQANRSMPLPTAFALVMTLRFPCEGAAQ